jgi:hypothetical protein
MSNPRSLETPQQPRKVFPDFPLFCGTLDSVDNYMWSAGGLFTLSAAEGLTLFFLRQPFRPCQFPKQSKSLSLKSITYEMLFL